MVERASKKHYHEQPINHPPATTPTASIPAEKASESKRKSTIAFIALQKIKEATLPSESTEILATSKLETAQNAKIEATCALHMFLQAHSGPQMTAYEKQEQAHLEWEAAKSDLQMKESHLVYLAILHAPQESDDDTDIDPKVLEILSRAHHELAQAKLDEAAAKTHFFSQKVEVARGNLATLRKPSADARPQDHLHYLSQKAIYVAAMSQHMAAYLEEAELKHADALELVKALEAQGNISSEMYVEARRYLRETQEDLEDAKLAHANVLAIVEPSKLSSFKSTSYST